MLQIFMWCSYISQYTPAFKQPEHHIYFVGRASLQKSALIAKEFNLADTLISHVGIGIQEREGLVIFHVEDKPNNALVKSTLPEFVRNQEFYYCVYALPVSKEEIGKLKNILANHKPVEFDNQLMLGNQALYCSEFCFNVLISLDPQKFRFIPVTKLIENPFIASYLGRKSITYVPVDFFIGYPGLKKVSEEFLPASLPSLRH